MVEKQPKVQFEVGRQDEAAEEARRPGAADDKGIVEQVDDLILQAIRKEATDIHIEPTHDGLRVRARVEGRLVQIAAIAMELHPKVINRVKILSSMDITRSRIPQRGYFKVIIEERRVELYVYCFPSVLGEKVVLQVHYRKGVQLGLEHLGLFPTMLKPFREAVRQIHGLILVVGPPGNGKTTTSYAVLKEKHAEDKLVMSFEHVLKYELPGMVQGRPDEIAEFTFPDGIRAMMDQEPDMALVGEVNESEVARSIIQGAFAARMVVARMTGNDSISAVQTLVDMGVQPFLVTASLNAVLAQRTVRKICDKCREPYEPPPAVIEELGYRLPDGTKFFHGKGCQACRGTGYRGVLGIFELFVPNEETNELIVARAPQNQVREAALTAGMTPLKKDGIQKAVKGYTPIEEVLSVL